MFSLRSRAARSVARQMLSKHRTARTVSTSTTRGGSSQGRGAVAGAVLGVTAAAAASSVCMLEPFTSDGPLRDNAERAAWLSAHPNVTILTLKDNASTTSLKTLLTAIRDQECSHHDFVFYFDRAMRILVEATLGSMEHAVKEVKTPTGYEFEGIQLAHDIAGVSILRSGDSMLKGFSQVIPNLVTGKVLISRDRSQPDMPHIVYYSKLPKDIKDRQIVLMDPMLASGVTAQLAIEVLIEHGVSPENITLLNMIVTPTGVDHISKLFPQVKIIAATMDAEVDNSKYIVPGLGVFGDRYYGTG